MAKEEELGKPGLCYAAIGEQDIKRDDCYPVHLSPSAWEGCLPLMLYWHL